MTERATDIRQMPTTALCHAVHRLVDREQRQGREMTSRLLAEAADRLWMHQHRRDRFRRTAIIVGEMLAAVGVLVVLPALVMLCGVGMGLH